MNASAATPGAAWRKHGIEPMPHSDGKETTLLEILYQFRERQLQADPVAEIAVLLQPVLDALVEVLMAEVEQGDEDEQPARYMDGSRTS